MLSLRGRVTHRTLLLLVGDLACFLLFAVLGLRSHEDGISAAGLVRAATPFQLGWLAIFLLRSGRATDAPARLQGIVRMWVPAWALGLVLRTLLFDRSLEASFAVVALLVNGVLLLLWRGLLAPLLLPGKPGRSDA